MIDSLLGLDGGTSGLEREKLINAFNAPNSNAKLFLLSTRLVRRKRNLSFFENFAF